MDYQPPSPPDLALGLEERTRHRVRGLDRAIRDGLAKDSRDAALWLAAPARERVAMGMFKDSHPFDLCIAAAHAGRGDAVMAFLDAGCEPVPKRTPILNREGESDWDPNWPGLLCACAGNNLTEPMRRIANKISVDEPIGKGVTALMVAAAASEKNCDDAFFLLLELGANPLIVTRKNTRPIMSAALGNSPAIIAKLLELGADPRAKPPGGLSAMDYAAGLHESCFLALVEARELATLTPAATPNRRAAL